MAEYYSVVQIHHIFFICLSVGGHSGCLRVLATVNSASLKIRVMHFFDLEFSSFSCLDICPGVGLLNCTVTLFLFFNFIYPFTYLFFYHFGSSGSSWRCVGFPWSRWEGLLLAVMLGCSCYGVQAPGRTGSAVVVHGVLAASRHVQSSQGRDQTHGPCVGGWILNHWTT